jgi:hypothetical protein
MRVCNDHYTGVLNAFAGGLVVPYGALQAADLQTLQTFRTDAALQTPRGLGTGLSLIEA